MAEITQWTKCYESGWKDIIVPEAFSHPAKMSYGLLKRILAHAKEQGWLKEGDVIVDPFGGIGSTGILGAYEGYQVVCVELEEKFVDLARKNFVLHNNAWYKFGNPYPVILQGDSRRLCELIEKADCIVSSPPYSQLTRDANSPYLKERLSGEYDKKRGYKPNKNTYTISDGYGQTPGQLGSMKPGSVDAVVSSPPFQESSGAMAKPDSYKGFEHVGSVKHKKNDTKAGYGNTPGNLGNLKPGQVDTVISSPPFGQTGQPKASDDDPTISIKGRDYARNYYGQTEGNLGNLKPGQVDCTISSPPYECAETRDRTKFSGGRVSEMMRGAYTQKNQGNTEGNIAKEQGETFWQAARQIVQQCHQILKPGGVAIWVVKAFVRKGAIVDFPGDWKRLCESVGFVMLCEHQAMLVKETTHKTLFGDIETEDKESKSFFRRLLERNYAWNKYWQTLTKAKHDKWLKVSHKDCWDSYNSHTEEEKQDWLDKEAGILRYSPPTKATILGNAKCWAFGESKEKLKDWNKEIRIDFENVLCMRKGEIK